MSGSTQRSRPVSTAAVVTHGRVDVDEAVAGVRAIAARAGVRLVDDPRDADIALALGGDGTMLRTLAQLLGSNVPVIGVNFGRVGFLASIRPDDLERDIERVLAGEYVVVELSTLEVRLGGDRHVAVNDVVATSSTLGRMVELAWATG
jgi:NAD kinase